MIINYKKKELTLTQDPFPSDLIGREDFYQARAIDEEGNDYRVFWNVISSSLSCFVVSIITPSFTIHFGVVPNNP